MSNSEHTQTQWAGEYTKITDMGHMITSGFMDIAKWYQAMYVYTVVPPCVLYKYYIKGEMGK